MSDFLDYLFDDWLSHRHEHDCDEDIYMARGSSRKQKATCRFCGKRGLTWKKLNGQWQLTSKGQSHECNFSNDFTKSKLMSMIPSHPIFQELLALPVEDQCLVHRVLYYVFARPVISDHEYDMLERDATMQAPEDHLIQRPGSDREETYPAKVVELAYRIHNPLLQ